MREAEMDEIQKEVRAMSDGVKASFDDATRSVESVRQSARVDQPKPAPVAQAKAADPANQAPPSAAPASTKSSTAEPSQPVMASEALADDPEPSILPPGKTPDKTGGPD
jgi:sec-independent protein translocase protein TatB